MRVAAIKPAFLFCQQSGQQRSQGAADAVDGNSAYRIVDFNFLVDEFNGEDNGDSGDDPDHKGAGYGHKVAAGSDGYQAGQGAVQRHGNIRFAVTNPGQEHHGTGRHGGGHVGGNKYMGRRFNRFVPGHADSGAAVEPEPGEPEDKYAQCCQRQAVSGNGIDGTVFIVFANTGSQQPGADTGAHAAYHVYGGGTGKIVEPRLGQPAAAPDPVAGNGVDEQTDQDTVNAVGRKLGPFRHGAGNDSCRRGAENGLENQEGHGRIPCFFPYAEFCHAKVRRSDEAADVRTEHKAKTHDPECRCAQRKIHDVFHDDVAGVFSAGQACFTHGKPRLHEKDQCSPQQHPDGVRGRITLGQCVRCKGGDR